MEPKLTPMMIQYNEAKREYPDHVLFFRMGDFYEMFGDDAVEVSRVLGLTLTSRSKGTDGLPMAGVPHHSADKYIKTLIDSGYRVAVCEQTADPAQCKGIVPREVVRVITPGTLTGESELDNASSNYLASFSIQGKSAGIVWADLSTGELFLQEVAAEIVLDALECLAPSETLVPEDEYRSGKGIYADFEGRSLGLVTGVPDTDFFARSAAPTVCESYGVNALDGFGLEEADPALPAAAAVLRYIQKTQKARVRHLRAPRKIIRDDLLILDRATVRNLELVEPISGSGNRKATLFGAINRTRTGPGGRMLKNWMLFPLRNIERIRERQSAVKTFMADHSCRAELRKLMSETSDTERIVGRLGCGRAMPRDLASLGRTLKLLPGISEAASATNEEYICRLAVELLGLEELSEHLERTLASDPPLNLNEGRIFRTGFNEELDELRSISSGGKEWIARFQSGEAERTGISNLKVKFNKVFGYYIEITKSNLEQVPEDYERRQTLVNAERFVTPELKEYERKVMGAEEKIVELEYKMFLELREYVAQFTGAIQKSAEALSSLDSLSSLAEWGVQGRCVIPEVDDGDGIDVREGRHPVVESMLPAGKFVPNDMEAGHDRRMLIITGPNMSGKSTYIRQCALLIILAQMGAPLPASSARVGLADRVFTRVGASDDLARGRSTFMVEMSESANILNNATDKSFIVLDEVGRGTSTFDGVSLAWALTEHIHNRIGARCIFATHYHELAELGVILDGAANLNVAVRDWEGEVIFLHRIQPGSADRSYGIHVARLAGIPQEIIKRAQVILEGLEMSAEERDRSFMGGNAMGKTETLRAAARQVQMTLFDDPDRDSLINEIAAMKLDKLSPEEAQEKLKNIHARASRWAAGGGH